MPVPGRLGAVRNTLGGAFTAQRISAVSIGVTSTVDNIFSRAFSPMNVLPLNQLRNRQNAPIERAGPGTYNTIRPLAAGTFAFNSARSNTYVVARMSTSLAGVPNNAMLFMDQKNLIRTINVFNHDFGARMLTAWRAGLFSFTGRTTAGTKLLSRRLWLNSADRTSTAGAPLTTLTNVNMWDLIDGNATDRALDEAATSTRMFPGELVVKIDFVVSNVATSGNNLNYKPITHA